LSIDARQAVSSKSTVAARRVAASAEHAQRPEWMSAARE
jgi:hypothetical protein